MRLSPLDETPDLRERSYRAIKDAILSLEFRPGEFLTTGKLAESLNISRTPVREALLHLEQEGLVTLLPQKGAIVAEFHLEDIREIFELRIILEAYAAKVAAEQLTDKDMEQISAIMDESEKLAAIGEIKRASNAARGMHDILIGKVNNRRIKRVLDDLEAHYMRIRRFSSLIPGRLERSLEQHRRITDALLKRDSAASEAEMVRHLLSIRDEMLESVSQWNDLLDQVSDISE